MRVMFTLLPATAHLYPVVPLAWALKSAGHEVCVVSQPDLVGPVTAAGLTAVGLGEPLDHTPKAAEDEAQEAESEQPPQWDNVVPPESRAHLWDFFHRRILPALPFYYPAEPSPGGDVTFTDELVAFARRWQPDLVLWDPACIPSPIAARAVGAAHARLLWGLDYFAWSRTLFAPGEDPLTSVVRPLARRHGYEVDEELLLGQWTVDPVPPRLALPLGLPTVPVRMIPYNGGSEIPQWLLEEPRRPRVCVSLGVTTRERSKEGHIPLVELLQGLAELDAELVVTANAQQLASLGTLPENVTAIDYVPLTLLLPSCAAILHHGGGGTFTAAVTHSVPQLIAPGVQGDFLDTARYVEERGAGLVVDTPRFTVAAVRDQLDRILTEPGFREGATLLRQDLLDQPGPADIVAELERRTALRRDREGTGLAA
ncbi:DUF1205 domain-containing protein [Streptomyces sp. NBC_00237]|uniref:nucleotide disphospho-sugar-binding domain-containing protein n=1 Tax=Streptomyces sp. NBC_00237 TaxID=2975687 RepID=UPI0022510FD1|nr:nucleotide disphospho-sugar-binding domain-containing protein [Streptomyces sp. NBC_00237]MCX5203227.1 DUF1205 domain-containing protein [Streptomyces sp. NBC_00237]